MKRPTKAKPFEGRRHAAYEALPGCTQGAIARHVRILQEAVSRHPAAASMPDHDRIRSHPSASSLRDMTYALHRDVTLRIYAQKGPLCAYCCFAEEIRVSRSGARVCNDSRSVAGDAMGLVRNADAQTQVLSLTSEAARKCRSTTRFRR